MHFHYPETERESTSEILHGIRVDDPYRYLEDPDAARTKAFVQAQNDLSAPYLAALAGRKYFGDQTTRLLTAPRTGVPWRIGGRYFTISNPGELDQDRVHTADTLDELLAGGRILLDPNTFSTDGTVALSGVSVSPDGSMMGYAVSDGGSDWLTLRVVRTVDGEVLPDVIPWCKWAIPEWLPDGSGFLYWCYPEPAPGTELTDAMGAGSVKLHRIGTPIDCDTQVWAPEDPAWMADLHISADGRWLLLTIAPGTDSRSTVSAIRIGLDSLGRKTPNGYPIPVISELTDAYSVVESEGDVLYLRTEAGAGRGRLVKVDLQEVGELYEVVAEHQTDVLVSASRVADRFLLVWSQDAAHRLELVDLDGISIGSVELDGPISIAAVKGYPGDSEVFIGSSSFTRPLLAHRLELIPDNEVLTDLPAAGSEPLAAISTRVQARSTDGAMVPMTLLRRDDLPDGPRPTLLYGYGGFDIPVLPSFSAMFAAWVAAGGVLAVANLRGGGEFGVAWHEQGMLHNKQQVFDDAISCAEYLIAEGITTPGQLAVHGRSNGGLLVGALMTQRPELWAATLPTVGVMDMLRFHLFTIGWAWTTDYGSPENKDDFDVIRSYSPLHNVKPGVAYPPTLTCTGDHDDRVVPAHSLKFGAELQFCQSGDNPVLLRIDTRAGHGAGKPARALAAEYADQLAFAAEHTGLVTPAD